MMNIEKYFEVLEEKVVTDFSNTFPDGSGVFQQDSALCHKAKIVMKYMKKMKIYEKNEMNKMKIYETNEN